MSFFQSTIQSPKSKITNNKAAFNLIELLIAMTVLLVVVCVSALILNHAEEAWALGTGKARVQATGRDAINMIAQDLRHAVADERLTFIMSHGGWHPCDSYGQRNDEVRFVSFQHSSSDTNRAARMIYYWVRQTTNATERYELVRGCRTIVDPDATNAADNCYWATNWCDIAGSPPSDQAGIIAENVALFILTTPDGSSVYSSFLHTNQLPEYVDVFLELLHERTARQASELDSPRKEEFVEMNAHRFTTRVYFVNRIGYQPR